jgi:hypothetical protein
VSERYDDFDRALLRAGKRAVAPSRLRARAMTAAAAAGAATAATTKAAAATKVKGLAKLAKILTVKWTLVAAVTTASVGASVGTAVYVHETETRASAVDAPSVAPTLVVPVAAKAAHAGVPLGASASAEPAPTVEAVEPAVVSPASVAPASSAPAVSEGRALRPPPRVAPQAPAAPPAKSIDAFREELGLIDDARGALAKGDTSNALRLLQEHSTRFPSGAFVVERDVIRIDALVAAGRSDEATQSARAFLARHPGSAQAGRISKMVEKNP